MLTTSTPSRWTTHQKHNTSDAAKHERRSESCHLHKPISHTEGNNNTCPCFLMGKPLRPNPTLYSLQWPKGYRPQQNWWCRAKYMWEVDTGTISHPVRHWPSQGGQPQQLDEMHMSSDCIKDRIHKKELRQHLDVAGVVEAVQQGRLRWFSACWA